jgi:Domain of unknown function (DUF3291).
MPTYHLAQLNIGRILAPLDSPQLAGFVARLDEINALAEAAPGFVWRFQTEDGNATALRPYEDDRILVNFSCGPLPRRFMSLCTVPFTWKSCGTDANGSSRWTRPSWSSGGFPSVIALRCRKRSSGWIT